MSVLRSFSFQHFLAARAITSRLMLFLSIATMVVWLFSCISIYFVVRHETSEIFDQSLLETAHVMISTHTTFAAMVDDDDILPKNIPEIAQGTHSHRIIYQIWNADHKNVYRSLGAPIEPLGSLNQDETFGWTEINHRRYRTYQVWDHSHRYLLQIAERWTARESIFKEMVAHLTLVVLFFLPILGVLIFWSVRFALDPIRHITRQLAGRSGTNLSHLTSKQVPDEVAPLVATLNSLFSQVEALIEQERRFTSNAAHELRTPLAAVKLYAQVIQAGETSPVIREAATDIQEGVDRCGRIIEQLIVLARLDPEGPIDFKHSEVNLDQITQQVIDQYSYILTNRNIQLNFMRGQTIVSGSAEQLEILIRNLLDNAIRYSPRGTEITVGNSMINNHKQLFIRDSGPGIPYALQKQVFERFYRIQHSGASGSGLGLSIVQQIVKAHHAELKMQNCQPSGLEIVIKFH